MAIEFEEVLRATLLAAGFASAGTVLETLALDEDAILKNNLNNAWRLACLSAISAPVGNQAHHIMCWPVANLEQCGSGCCGCLYGAVWRAERWLR